MRDPIIGLDIDNVLANFSESFCRRALLHFPDEEFPRHWTEWREWVPQGANGNQVFNKVWDLIHDEEDFWMDIPPHDDAHFTFPVECYITARDIPTRITEAWLQKNGFQEAPVITVGAHHSKLPHVQRMGLDIFVDDKPSTYNELNKADSLCLLMSRPHNIGTPLQMERVGDEIRPLMVNYLAQVQEFYPLIQ